MLLVPEWGEDDRALHRTAIRCAPFSPMSLVRNLKVTGRVF